MSNDQGQGPFINEQRIDSPLENWPGYIVIPKELTAEQFHQWWTTLKRQETEEEDARPEELRAWESRLPFVLDWKIEGLKTADIEPTGLKLPSMKIALFVIRATTPLLAAARSLPKLRRSSGDTSIGKEAT